MTLVGIASLQGATLLDLVISNPTFACVLGRDSTKWLITYLMTDHSCVLVCVCVYT
jgi:hypothetical protein